MFKNQPKGLFALALANTGERFGYYTMLAIFLLFLQAKFGFTAAAAGQFYAIFLAAVYFMPVIGGWLADKIGYGKCVVTGVSIMFLGYVLLAIPTDAFTGRGIALVMMIGALLLIAVGTGLFKGNLQVMTGNLYDDPKYSAKRDSGFSLFYMAINIGAMFAPSAATALTNSHLAKSGLIYKADIPALAHQYLAGNLPDTTALQDLQGMMPGADIASMGLGDFSQYYINSLSTAYNLGFAVACVSLIFSMAVYFGFRSWFKHTDVNAKQAAASNENVVELTPKQTKDRIVALIFVFAVVIFFWMAFHQNGSSLTYFARDYTQDSVSGLLRIGFNIWPLFLIAVSVYTLFGIFQSEKILGKLFCIAATLLLWGGALGLYSNLDPVLHILPQQFQQFNPFFVVALTPVSMALFSALASKGKEPSAPKKIGLGMFVAAVGYLIMLAASNGQPAPSELKAVGGVSPDPVVPTYLIGTYLILTFAELLLSPMGISFVSKVAPPKYKGLMMGCWFAATAIGNYLSSIPSMLWDNVPLWVNWTVLMALCIISGVVMFSFLKKLEAATA
ncbi:MAG: peptide MFS transporter [Bacteroidales bacterium]|nr:peptide MFS transporter [Bacteroidales bacterium]MBQ9174116.1 peptide MFS transporter [Bacteroidales bacterium]MBQ9711276.1 peptide MFS transporter [Bacteroidales bacterium]MBR1434709.1 peptide MFS transporter [Bacteroidales bacterium]MBR6415688.1 peptide MFS transporter [Bacteroidales bacterium]